MKTYSEYMNEISQDDLYKGLLGFGMFAEKMPPIFTSEGFYDYCVAKNPSFADAPKQYAYYENVRNINIPRPLGIPVPMVYQKLVKYLSDIWPDIQKYFEDKTVNQSFKVSRIHIRKMYGKDKLFEMSYDNWRNDESPENKLIYGMKYVAHADISKCFPSIYTHSLPWALVGKTVSKKSKGNRTVWYNKLDHLVQINKDLETHGLIIGPHVSNVLSEIILCAVDERLVNAGWKYIRNIDDYSCYVESEEAAEQFFVDLQNALRDYDLSLNHKKTLIEKLPVAMVEQWVRKINTVSIVTSYGKVDYINCRAYLDYAIEIAEREKGNASVLNYAIKTLSGKNLTESAKKYEKDMVFHLCLLYPYLVPLLKEFVFDKCDATKDEVKKLSDSLFINGMKNRVFEQSSYAIYYSLVYDFDLNFSANDLIATNDCVLLTMGFLYFNKKKNRSELTELKKFAKSLTSISEDFERLWLFAYEALPMSELRDEWKTLKKNKVTFIRSI